MNSTQKTLIDYIVNGRPRSEKTLIRYYKCKRCGHKHTLGVGVTAAGWWECEDCGSEFQNVLATYPRDLKTYPHGLN